MIIRIPPTALKELQQLEDENWSVSAQDLVNWVNHTAERFLPSEAEGKSQRVSDSLSLRSMRHYQTLGCIDVPEKCGRMASYGYRHFVQALLVRRLLSERVPSEQILTLARRDTKELESMLRDGVEIAARPGDEDADTESFVSASEVMEVWNRMRLAPGLELHIHSKFPEVDKEEFERISALLERILMNRGS